MSSPPANAISSASAKRSRTNAVMADAFWKTDPFSPVARAAVPGTGLASGVAVGITSGVVTAAIAAGVAEAAGAAALGAGFTSMRADTTLGFGKRHTHGLHACVVNSIS